MQAIKISEDTTSEATITTLNPATTYSIQVAAVNSAGIGMYSNVHFVITKSKYI